MPLRVISLGTAVGFLFVVPIIARAITDSKSENRGKHPGKRIKLGARNTKGKGLILNPEM